MLHKFDRFEMLIGKDNLSLLRKKHILIIGVGGVGGYVAEALVRSGIENITIIDNDIVDKTNLNRQIIALESTIGRRKVDVLESRMKDINSNCHVITYNDFVTSSTVSDFLSDNIDYVVDACDTVDTKKAIIKECLKRDICFISCMGTAKKLDPSKLEIVDIRKTYNDPLARIIRKFVKNEGLKGKIDVLFSSEIPIKANGLGSSAFVPSSAGFLIASYVIRKLLDL